MFREGRAQETILLLPDNLLISLRPTHSSFKLGSMTFACILIVNAILLKLT